MRNVPLRMSALAAAVMLLMTACSDGDGGSEGEQAASVNGETVTVQQWERPVFPEGSAGTPSWE